MASELAVGYVTIVPSARGMAKGLEAELGGPLVAAGKASGAKSSTAFGTAFKTGVKTAAIGVGVVAGLAAIGQKFEGAFATIARGTGATGKTLEGLDNSFRTVLKNGAGTFDQVSQAVTTLYQRTGLTGKALEDFAAKEVTLARITKTDVGANLQATTGLFNLYGIAAKNQSATLDVLFRASQVAGVSITQLASDMQAAAPTAKILGLSIDQTAGLVANLDRAGLPASKVMLGLASAFAKAAKAGKTPLDVIHELVAEVKAAPNATAGATIAVQKFGIGARQAATLVAGLRSGAINLNATLSGGKGILDTAAATQTLSGRFAHLKNVALVGLEPLAKQTLGAVMAGVNALIPVVGFLTDHMQVLGPVILAAVGAFAAFKIALGVTHFVQNLATGFDELKVAIFGSTAASEAAAAAAATTAAAQTAEAVAATENAAALTVAAEAAAAAAVAGGAVDLAASSAASALLAEAAAATLEAEAMTAAAAATAEATVAAEGFALTPVGAVALAAGAAVVLLTGATKLFSHGQRDAGAATNSFVSSLLDEGKALGDVAGQQVIRAIRSSRDLDASLKATGLSVSEVAAAVGGSGKAYDDIKRKLDVYKTAQIAAATAGLTGRNAQAALGAATEKYGGQVRNVIGWIDKNKLSLSRESQAKKDADAASRQFAAGEQSTIMPAKDAAFAQDQLRIAATNLTTAIVNNADRLRGLQEGLIGVLSSAINLRQGLRDLAAKQTALTDAQKKYGKSSKEAAVAADDLALAQLQQLGNTKAAVDGVEKQADAQSHLSDKLKLQADAQKNLDKVVAKSGKGSTEAAAAQHELDLATLAVSRSQDLQRLVIERLAARVTGPLHDALVGYLHDTANLGGEIGKIPTVKTVTFTTPGLSTAATKSHDFRGELDGLKSKHITISLDAAAALHSLGLLDAQIRKINPTVSIVAVNRAEAGRSTTSLPTGAHGLVVSKPTVALIGENAHTTPEVVSPVALMAKTFAAELDKAGHGSGASVVFNGPIYTRDERELMTVIERRQRRAELLAGIN